MKVHLSWWFSWCGMLAAGSVSWAASPGDVLPPRFPDGVQVVAQASTLEALIRTAKPKFVWNDWMMLWVTHDAGGHVGFRMNRAVRIKLGASPRVWCLLAGGDGLNWEETDEDIRYEQAEDDSPTVIARDPQRGVVYQARWTSQRGGGSDHATDQRTVVLLCDAQHRWQFLGEGPIVNCYLRGGADGYATSEVEARATWTDDPTRPVRLSYLICDTDCFTPVIDPPGNTDPPVLKVSTLVSAVPGTEPKDERFVRKMDPLEEPFGGFVEVGPRYARADRDESLAQWAMQYRSAATETAEVQALVKSVHQLNPKLGDTLKAGRLFVVKAAPPPPGPRLAGDKTSPSGPPDDDSAESRGTPGDPSSLNPIPQPALLWK